MKVHQFKAFTIVVCCSIFALSSHETNISSSYQGSQALNYFLPLKEGVNNNTGSFNLNYPLVNLNGINTTVDLNIKLVYAAGSSGILGLPSGWTFDINYVIGNSVTLEGKSYITDIDWSDQKGHKSGLRYVNNHGIKFQQIFPPQALPFQKPGKYGYLMTYADGAHDYFDALGKLILHADRFGNNISYSYCDQFKGVIGNCLKEITDSYGQKILFRNGTNRFTVELPNAKGGTTIEYSKAGIEKITNALGHQTIINYESRDGISVINHIIYPSGLETIVTYQTLGYSMGSTKKGFPAVDQLTRKDANGSILEITKYNFGPETGNTFTGGDKHKLSTDKDGLMESKDTLYFYDVLIVQLDTQGKILAASRAYYNYLHLPTTIDQYLITAGKCINCHLTRYSYEPSMDLHSRSTNYNKAIATEQLVWSQQDKKYIPMNKIENTHDDYGNLLTQKNSLYDCDNNKFCLQCETTNTYYNTSSGCILLKSNTTKDCLTGFEKQIITTLTQDQNSIETKKMSYKEPRSNAFKSWKNTFYQYDEKGKMCRTETAWDESVYNNKLGIKSTSITKNYNYDASKHLLTVTITNAKNHSSITTIHTNINGAPPQQAQYPDNSVVKFDYDKLGRLIEKTDGNGRKWKVDYFVQSRDKINKVRKTSPLGYIEETYHDALGRDVKSMDNGVITIGSSISPEVNRTLSETTYNLLNLMSSTKDILGLETTHDYDSLGRLVRTTNISRNNTVTIDYDDCALTVTKKTNGRLMGITYKDSMGRTIKTENYPAPGQENYFIRDSVKYDGNSQPIICTLEKVLTSNPTQSTILSTNEIIRYDMEGTAIETVFTGYDINNQASKQTRCALYDLLGNKISHTKETRYADGRKYDFTSDVALCNELGQLEKITNQIGQNKRYSYYPNGSLHTETSFEGTEFCYTYDANGNIKTKEWDGKKQEYTYYEDNSLKSTTLDGQRLQYSYYPDGSLYKEQYPDNSEQVYVLDKNSRLHEEIDPAGSKTTYTYLPTGQLNSISHKGDTLNNKYGEVNSINGVLRELDVTGSKNLNMEFKAFDGFDAPKHISYGVDSNEFANIAYERYPLGGIKSIKQSSQTNSTLNLNNEYSYDGLKQLSHSKHSEQEIFYEYDGNGNLEKETLGNEKRTSRYNKIDQLQKDKITYSDNGAVKTDEEGRFFDYNKLDQLVKVTNSDGSIIEYKYYPNGLLAQVITKDKTEVSYYVSGIINAIKTIKDSKETWTTFLLNGAHRISSYSDGTTQYYLLNNRSSSVALKDGETISYDYDDYGKINKNKDKLTSNDSFAWNQEYLDVNTDLVYLRARFYNTTIKRFMSMDSYNLDNKYMYCNGDPINNIDPSGHSIIGDIIGIGIGIWSVGSALLTGGSSLMIGAAVASGTLFTVGSCLSLAGEIRGDEGLSKAGNTLCLTGAALDVACFAAGKLAPERMLAAQEGISVSPAASKSHLELFETSNPGINLIGLSDSQQMAVEAVYYDLNLRNSRLLGGMWEEAYGLRDSTYANRNRSISNAQGRPSEHSMGLRNSRALNQSPPPLELWDGSRPNFNPGVRELVYEREGYSVIERGRMGGNDIHHVIPWQEDILNRLDPHVINGWQGYLQSEVNAVYNDVDNLRVLGAGPNRSLGHSERGRFDFSGPGR